MPNKARTFVNDAEMVRRQCPRENKAGGLFQQLAYGSSIEEGQSI